MRTTALLLVSAGCALPELASPQSGSCSEATESNRWPQFEGERPTVTETGWETGQVAPDFELVDQFGDPTCLWQMAGNHVVIDVSALWCVPCRRISSTVPCQTDTIADLVYMTFIVQDDQSQPAAQEHAEEWAAAFGLDQGNLTPVLADGGEVVTSQFTDGSVLPVLVLLDPELKVVTRGVGEEADVEIRAELESATGASLAECEPTI